MKKILKKCKKIFKKSSTVLMALGILVASFGFPAYVTADDAMEEEVDPSNNTILVYNPSRNTAQIDTVDSKKVNIMKDGNLVGSFKVKIGEFYQNPTLNGSNIQFLLTKWAEDYQISVELTIESGYEKGNQYIYNGNHINYPGSGDIGLDITSNNIHNVDFVIDVQGSSNNNSNNQSDIPPSMMNWDIFAKFEGVNTNIHSNQGNILIPESWTSEKVELFATVCTSLTGNMVPYNSEMIAGTDYQVGTVREEKLDIEGINNLDQINNSVRINGTNGNKSLIILNDFYNYGVAGLHLVKPNENNNLEAYINTTVKLITDDVVFVKTESPLAMSFSYGTATLDSAVFNINNNKSGDVSIFFGNTSTTLKAEGSKVQKISEVIGGTSVVYNNENGSATVNLPPLSNETTTNLTLKIQLQDGTIITRKLNVIRTAIELRYNNAQGGGTLEAGYVMNKAYLYNNQNHNDEIFNAYLQVILYKDNVVAGYKQIKINDEEVVNRLHENESGSMEVYDNDNKIVLYGTELNDTIEGVNHASVFLTNGPIDGNSNLLPSIEFGIGAGVEISWDAE
ncbi:MAG TPA: hypothetical protein PLV83_05775 [Bacilli bacterium]|nr:hypothetical protein [Bacilli bacterium]